MNNEDRKTIIVQPIVHLFFSVITYAIIVLIFLGALIDPNNNINFIYNSAIFIFIAEFLSIHSSAIISNKLGFKENIFVIVMYMALIVPFSFLLNSFYPAIVLTLSIIAKVFNRKSEITVSILVNMLVFFGSTFLVITCAPIIQYLIVIPNNVLDQRPVNVSRIIYRLSTNTYGLGYYILFIYNFC